MHAFKRFINLRGVILLIVVVLMVHLAQAAFAQDDTSAPADPDAVVITTDADATDVPSAPTDVVPTDVATDETPIEVIPTDVAPTEVVNPVPTDVVGGDTSNPPPVVNVVPTQAPPFVPTVLAPARVVLLADNTTFALNTVASVKVGVQGLVNAYSMALLCEADPTHLQGLQSGAGDLLTTDDSTIIDNGFQSNGEWVIIAGQRDGAPALLSAGILTVLNYEVIAGGTTQITCQIQLANRSGQALPLDSAPITVAINGYQDPTIPTVVVVTPQTPVTDNVPIVTAIPTEPVVSAGTAVPTAIPTIAVYHLQGYVSTPFMLMDTAITLSSASGQKNAILMSDNSFAFDVPSGEYDLMITTRHHVPFQVHVTIANQPILLPLITLHDGDVDGNGVVDSRDIAVVVANFGLNPPASNIYPDLNGDGSINIYDLTIVSAGLHD